MLFLRTFGGLSLENGGRPVIGAAGQPRRLAILAVLAAADDAGLSRDQLCTLFWPDSDMEHARGALKQAIHALRRDVREQELVTGTSGLRLNRDVLISDVGSFTRALFDGDLETAVAWYTGSFLDGVQIRGESGFERWADENRRALATRYANALETLTVTASSAGNTAAAVDWARRLNAADPFNTRANLLFINALDAAGDRASAIKRGELHAAQLRDELGVEPSTKLTQTLARLREPPQPASYVESAPRESATPTVETPPSRAVSALVAPADTPSEQLETTDTRPTRRRFSALVVSASLLLAAGVFIALRLAPRMGAPESERGERLVIVPFETESSHNGDSLREVATSLFATALRGAPHVTMVEPRAVWTTAPRGVESDQEAGSLAQHFHADRFVRGVVLLEGSHVSLRATLHDRRNPTSSLFSVEAEGSADSLFSVTNRLAAEFLAAQYPARRRSLVEAAARSTPSLDAFKAYLSGDDAMAAKRYPAAVLAYQRAVGIDAGFALAYYALSLAADWAPNNSVMRVAADSAVRTSGRLGDHERLLVTALRAWRHDDFDEAERLYRRLIDSWRDDVEAHYQLAEVLFHGNPSRGRSFLESEPEYLHVLAADPHNDDAILHLARIAASLGDAPRADSLLKLVIASTPDSQSLELRTFRAAAVRDSAAFSRLAAQFEHREDEAIVIACTRIAVWTRDLERAEQLCRLLTSPLRSPGTRAMGRVYLAQLAMAGGDRVRARLELAQVPDVGRPGSVALGAWIETLPDIPVDGPALRVAREELTRVSTVAAMGTSDRITGSARPRLGQRHYFLALLDRALGDNAAASHEMQALYQPPAAPMDTMQQSYFLSLSARIALEGGHMADALSLSVPQYPVTAIDELSGVSDRFVRAAALLGTGHRQDALDAYNSFDGGYISSLVLAAPAHLQRAALFEHDGLLDDARHEYDLALALWRRPDPVFLTLSHAARRHRAALGRVAVLRTR